MVQFRNFIVHWYEKVDVKILANVVNRYLMDFECFKQKILEYVRQSGLDDIEEHA